MKSVNRVFPCWPGTQCPGPRAALKLAGSQASRIVMIFVVCALARPAKSSATLIPIVNHLIVPPSCRAFASVTEGLASPGGQTCGTQSDALVGTFKRQGAELPPLLYFAVECCTLPCWTRKRYSESSNLFGSARLELAPDCDGARPIRQ